MSDEPITLIDALSMACLYDPPTPTPTDYKLRYEWLMRAVGLAVDAGVEVGFRIDPAEPTWPVVYFELPTGQASWHLPQHPKEWDGHETSQKHGRVFDFALRIKAGGLYPSETHG